VSKQARGMTATELTRPLDAPDGVEPDRAADQSDSDERASAASEHQARHERLGEIAPLIDAIPGYGPPAIVLAGPLVLFALVLAGPFLLLLTLVVLLVACAGLATLAGAIVASPYLLVRRLGGQRLPRTHRSAAAVQFVPVDSGRGPA